MRHARKKALLSVYDKTGIVEFARELDELGWDIYASGGTAEEIKKGDVRVKDVADLVGGGPILGHRVATLSREIHAGLLAADNSQAELDELGIPRIDLVCVDMYPLEKAIANPDSTEETVTEMTDIGGSTLLRSAAKGRRIVLSRVGQRSEVIKWLKADSPDKEAFIKRLAAEAELAAAEYTLKSAEYLNKGRISSFVGKLSADLRYGENPWQEGIGLFAGKTGQDDPLALDKLELIAGKPLSYTNYTDVDRLLQTITHIAAVYERNFKNVPRIVLGAKHGNVCGAAVHESKDSAIKNMLDGDPRAIFGGVIMCNFRLEKRHVELLKNHGMEQGRRLIDILIAPEFSEDAKKYLAKARIRLFANPALADLGQNSLDAAPRYRYVRGGMLSQQNYTYVLDLSDKKLRHTGRLTASIKRDMALAWAIGSSSNSNTIAIVKNQMLLGNGVGQQDRVSAAQLAVNRAREAGHAAKLHGATAYSDSFFPFPDAPESLVKAGVSAILATSGSVRDEEVAKVMGKLKVAFCTLPDEYARGFFAH